MLSLDAVGAGSSEFCNSFPYQINQTIDPTQLENEKLMQTDGSTCVYV